MTREFHRIERHRGGESATEEAAETTGVTGAAALAPETPPAAAPVRNAVDAAGAPVPAGNGKLAVAAPPDPARPVPAPLDTNGLPDDLPDIAANVAESAEAR